MGNINIHFNTKSTLYEYAPSDMTDKESDISLSIKKNETDSDFRIRAAKIIFFLNYGACFLDKV